MDDHKGLIAIALFSCIIYQAIEKQDEETIRRYENPNSLYHFAVKDIIANYRLLYPKNQLRLF